MGIFTERDEPEYDGPFGGGSSGLREDPYSRGDSCHERTLRENSKLRSENFKLKNENAILKMKLKMLEIAMTKIQEGIDNQKRPL